MNVACYLLFSLVLLCIVVPKERILLISPVLIVCLATIYKKEIMNANGLISVVIFCAIAYLHFYKDFKYKIYAYYLFTLIFIVITYCFITHKMPGFNNSIILNHIKISPTSSYFSMNINFDKVICALLIFIMDPYIKSPIPISMTQIKDTAIILIMCILFLIIPAMYIEYIKFDPKIPDITLIWIINNLFFVSFSEEVIFRGYIQNRLHIQNRLGKYRLGKFRINATTSIFVSSFFFGLYHIDKGIIFVIFSAICGLFYGYAFYKTQKNILCSMLVHFLLNFCHFICFTYPHYLR